jgi:DNA (cytosine-5)-methyltransferase 1
VIIETLRDEGYVVSDIPAVFSPHLLPPERGGRPQIRERVFIVAVRGADPEDAHQAMIIPPVECRPVGGWDPQTWNLEEDLLDPVPDIPGCELSDAEIHWIEAWNDFVVCMWEEREGRRLPGFPLWGDDWVHRDELSIPPNTPKWKYDFLRKNAEFYTEHQEFIDDWSEKWEFHTDKFPPSRRKFEWQAQDTPDLWSTVMHLRPSGIRAKRPTYLPALVAITQTSIIGPLRRRLSPREAARLQGLPDWFDFGDQSASATYKQLGNAVSVGAVWHVTREAARLHEETLKKVAPKLARCLLESDESPDKAILELENLVPSAIAV